MKSHRKVLTLRLPDRTGFVNITGEVEAAVRESGVQEGLCLVNSMHITSSVFINDEEGGLKQDYLRWLEKLAPFNAGSDPAQGGYLHNRSGETTATPTTSARSWAAKWWWQSRRGGWTSDPGSRSSTVNSTAAATSAC